MRIYPVRFEKTLTIFSMALVGKTLLFETSDGLYWAPNKRVKPCPVAARTDFMALGISRRPTPPGFEFILTQDTP